MMRALQCTAYAAPPTLTQVDLPVPQPGPGDLVIGTAAAGLGFVDALLCAGLYQIKPPLPYIPGNEVAGTVIAVGTAVAGFAIGDRVAGLAAGGGLADAVALRASLAAPVPATVSLTTAAATVTNYCTCYHGLIELGRARAGETILVLGAGGGIGLAAIDLARTLGLTIVAIASSQAKRDAARAQGAAIVIDGGAPDWRGEIERAIGKGKVDIVIDPVGGEASETAFRLLAPGGRHLVVGFASGTIPRLPLNLPLLKRASVVGVDWGGAIRADPALFGAHWPRVLEMLADGRLRPALPPVVGMSGAADALGRLASRAWSGKLTIEVSS